MTDEQAIREAKDRFLRVCAEWAESLANEGMIIGYATPDRTPYRLAAKPLAEWLPQLELPDAQRKVWEAGYKLIGEVRDATVYEP